MEGSEGQARVWRSNWYGAVFMANLVIALFGTAAIGMNIMSLSDQAVVIRTAGNPAPVWASLFFGIAVWVAAGSLIGASRRTVRDVAPFLAIWTLLQIGVVVVVFALSPHEPWS